MIDVTKVKIGIVTEANRPRHARHEPEFDEDFDIFEDDSADRGYNDDRGSRAADSGDHHADRGVEGCDKAWRREAPASRETRRAGAAGAAGAGSAAGVAGATGSARAAEGAHGAPAGAEPAGGGGAHSDRGAAAEEKPGPPIRGLAMIILAVAVLLIGWGAFSLLGGKDDGKSQNTAQTQSANNNGQPEQANPAGQSGQAGSEAPGSENPEGAKTDGADKPEDANKSGDEKDSNRDGSKPGESQANAPAAPGGAAGGAAQGVVNKENEYVTVLNNSPIQGLAGDTAKKLSEQKWAKTGYGNLADTNGTFPKSVVLYPGDNPNARAAAEQIASDLGLKAQPRDGRIDETLRGAKMLEGGAPAAVVVITTNDMPR